MLMLISLVSIMLSADWPIVLFGWLYLLADLVTLGVEG